MYESNGQRFYVDKKLFETLSKFKVENLKKKDNNKIFLVCGDTGVGKSGFSFQASAIIDKNFSMKNISFTNKQFKENLKNNINAANVHDEAFRGASSRNVMSKGQKGLLENLYEIRQLNQAIFLNSPSFFRLDEAIAVELSDAMFYIYKLANGRRAFKVYNKKKKENLYYRAKRYKKSYEIVYTGFKGLFSDNYVVNEVEYRKRKFEATMTDEVNEVKKDKNEDKINEMKETEAKLYAGLVKATGSYGNTKKLLKEIGLDINKGRIHDKIAPRPLLQRFVQSQS